MVSKPERTAPSTAGTDPVPPTSQDRAWAAATCGAPAGNRETLGSSPASFHQPFSEAKKKGSAQYSAGW